jgi:hypothetical protein
MSIEIFRGGGLVESGLLQTMNHGDYVFHVRVDPPQGVTSTDVSNGTLASLISTFGLA